jgi:hypothetical protein
MKGHAMPMLTPRHGSRALVAIVAFAIVAIPVARATIAATSTIIDEPPVPRPEQVVERLRETYSTTSVRERVAVTYRRRVNEGAGPAGERRRSSVLFVQTQPARSAGADSAPEPARAWIRAGNLRVWTEESTVRVASDAADSPVFEQLLTAPSSSTPGPTAPGSPDTPPAVDTHAAGVATLQCVDTALLGRVLPPLPLPQLDLWCCPGNGDAAEDAPVVQRLTPYAQDIRWTGVSRDVKAGTIEVSGVCESGTIAAVCVERTSRLRRVSIELIAPIPVSIVMEIQAEGVGGGGGEAASRGLPPLFDIDVNTRRRLTSMRKLAESIRYTINAEDVDWAGVQTLDGASAAGFLKTLSKFELPQLVLMVRAMLDRLLARPEDEFKAQPVWIVMSVCSREAGGLGAAGVDERVLERVEAWAAELKPRVTGLGGHVLWTCEPKWAENLTPNDEPMAWILLRLDQTISTQGALPDLDAKKAEVVADAYLDRILKRR